MAPRAGPASSLGPDWRLWLEPRRTVHQTWCHSWGALQVWNPPHGQLKSLNIFEFQRILLSFLPLLGKAIHSISKHSLPLLTPHPGVLSVDTQSKGLRDEEITLALW